MTAPSLRATGRAAAENELLAQLGLPPSAAPEDVDEIHEAVSEYLAAAPPGIRGWAHAQAAAVDAAYLQLTDPVGFGGSALRSPTRPPRVVPGGPATPPARRASIPVAPPRPTQDPGAEAPDDEVEPDEDDLEALYASVTPSAHPDMLPDARAKARKAAARRGRVALSAATAPGTTAASPWRWIVLGGAGVVVVLAVVIGAYLLGGGGKPAGAGDTAQASPTAPAVDAAKIESLMQKLVANPSDTATLLDLANEYYAGGQYDTASLWLDKLLAIDPKNVRALLAKGAVSFNTGDSAAAEKTWKDVLGMEPDNIEAHYDLGFLYFYQATPDLAAVQREWGKVIELDPASSLAKNAKAHLDALAEKSMIPASPAASGAASPGASPSASPAATPATSPAASPVASVQP